MGTFKSTREHPICSLTARQAGCDRSSESGLPGPPLLTVRPVRNSVTAADTVTRVAQVAEFDKVQAYFLAALHGTTVSPKTDLLLIKLCDT